MCSLINKNQLNFSCDIHGSSTPCGCKNHLRISPCEANPSSECESVPACRTNSQKKQRTSPVLEPTCRRRRRMHAKGGGIGEILGTSFNLCERRLCGKRLEHDLCADVEPRSLLNICADVLEAGAAGVCAVDAGDVLRPPNPFFAST